MGQVMMVFDGRVVGLKRMLEVDHLLQVLDALVDGGSEVAIWRPSVEGPYLDNKLDGCPGGEVDADNGADSQ